jgi:hypothetical protein
MATKKKVAATPAAKKKHWFTEKKGTKGKAAYLAKHPNSRYHPQNAGPPKPAAIVKQQANARKQKSAATKKAANERIEKYKALIKKGEQRFIKLGQRPKDSTQAQAWEAKRKKILDGIRKYKLAIRGAQSAK